MTNIEITLNRMKEIILSKGYGELPRITTATRYAKYSKKGKMLNYVEIYDLSHLTNKVQLSIYGIVSKDSSNEKSVYDTGLIEVDYEELTLLIDIFNKNYH